MSASRTHDGNRHGPITHELQQRIINRQEATTPADIEPVNETIEEASARHSQPPIRYDNQTGNRGIERGANHDSDHRKHRT